MVLAVQDGLKQIWPNGPKRPMQRQNYKIFRSTLLDTGHSSIWADTAVKWYQARYLRWCNWALRSIQIYSQNPHHHLPSSNPLIHIPRVQPRVDPRDKSFLSKSMKLFSLRSCLRDYFYWHKIWFQTLVSCSYCFPFEIAQSQNYQHSCYEFCGDAPGRIAALIWG